MIKQKWVLLLSFIILFHHSIYAATPKKDSKTWLPHYGIEMENNSNENVKIRFEKDIGTVFLDPPIRKNTLVRAHDISSAYEVMYTSNDPSTTFKIIFSRGGECSFTVKYFIPIQEKPNVTVSGEKCQGASYRLEEKQGYDSLILSVG